MAHVPAESKVHAEHTCSRLVAREADKEASIHWSLIPDAVKRADPQGEWRKCVCYHCDGTDTNVMYMDMCIDCHRTVHGKEHCWQKGRKFPLCPKVLRCTSCKALVCKPCMTFRGQTAATLLCEACMQ